MANTKTAAVNYTEIQASELVSAYNDKPTMETVEKYAVKFGKSVKSIIAKLSREGVYKKKEYVTKNGEKAVKKDEIATAFQKQFDLTDAEADSLTKANKSALVKIMTAFVAAKIDAVE